MNGFQMDRDGRLSVLALLPLVAAAGCASPPASDARLDSVPEFARAGPYLATYGIEAYEHFDTSRHDVVAGNSDLGAGATVGYRVSPEAAIEGVAEDVRGFRLSDRNVRTDLDLLNFGVLGKYFLATDRVQPYLVGGVGLARSDVSHFDYDHDGGFLRGGLGAELYLTHDVAIFGQITYDRMVGGVSDLDHVDLHLGVMLRF